MDILNYIDKMQQMFYEYNRMHEVVLQTKTEDDLEKRQMIDTIRKMGDTEQVRLTTIQCLEEDISKLQKTNHEYAEMIKSFEDKLAEKDKDTESSNKFSMIRIQADELGKKDMEIERLNKLIYNLISIKFIDGNFCYTLFVVFSSCSFDVNNCVHSL